MTRIPRPGNHPSRGAPNPERHRHAIGCPHDPIRETCLGLDERRSRRRGSGRGTRRGGGMAIRNQDGPPAGTVVMAARPPLPLGSLRSARAVVAGLAGPAHYLRRTQRRRLHRHSQGQPGTHVHGPMFRIPGYRHASSTSLRLHVTTACVVKTSSPRAAPCTALRQRSSETRPRSGAAGWGVRWLPSCSAAKAAHTALRRAVSRLWPTDSNESTVPSWSRRRDARARTSSLCCNDGCHGPGSWDGTGENPYLGMLALSEHIVVTEDSASMVSESGLYRKTGLYRRDGRRKRPIRCLP